MPFYFFAWVASFLFAFDIIISKLTSKYSIKNPWYFNYLWSLILLIITFPIAFINHVGIPKQWDNLFIASVFNTLVGIFFILTLYKLDVSVFSPLFNFRTVFSVLLGALLLGEILTTFQYALIGIIFLAGILVSIDEKLKLKTFFQKSIVLMIFLTMSLSLMSIFIKKAMVQNGYWEVTLWVSILSHLFLTATIPFFYKEIKKVNKKQIGAVGLIALFSTLGTLASNKAYAENVSISSVIISLPLSMFIAFLFSIFAPKLLEKHTLKVYAIRFTAAAVMIISALKLSS